MPQPDEQLDVDELCREAGRAITYGYRNRIDAYTVRTADTAHGRIVNRTRGRGQIPSTDPDVRDVLDLLRTVEEHQRRPAPPSPAVQAAPWPHDLGRHRPLPAALHAAIRHIDHNWQRIHQEHPDNTWPPR